MSRRTGAKDALEIVVVIDAVLARAPLLRGEGGELAGDSQQLLVETLGMHVARRSEVLENRDFAVQGLEHQVVGALEAAAGRASAA